MALPRVYDIAKELGIETAEALAKLSELGEYVKSGSSTIAPPVANKLRAAFPNAKPKEEEPKVTKAKTTKKAEAKEVEQEEKPAEAKPEEKVEPKSAPTPPTPGIPRPGNNPFAAAQGMGIPRPMARPGNNPFASNQGMGKTSQGGNRPPGARPGGATGSRPGSRPAGSGAARPGGFSKPGASVPPGPGGFPPPGRPGAGGRGRGGNAAGAFGKGGAKGASKARKSKRAKREEFEQRTAPSLGGAVVPRGDGNTVVRLRRGASIQDFADKNDANAGQLITVLFHLGQMATATASLDEETFQILGEELGYKVEVVSPEDEERELFDSFGLDISDDGQDNEE
ncbi:MAG: translation initiation factor IF-2 N-terminal domain-containing protein, partial [Rhodoluna sp.]